MTEVKQEILLYNVPVSRHTFVRSQICMTSNCLFIQKPT